jgi:hypothetical protein
MLTNYSFVDSTSGSNFSNGNQTEDGIFLLNPEFVNIILLVTVICQIYTGIEIEHPIFAIVFCNLCVSLISSFFNFVMFPFVKILSFSSLMNGNNVMCFMFHYSSWCILSVLRYLYVLHHNWLHKKFPETKTISSLAITAIVLTHCLCAAINTTAAFFSGWPSKKFLDPPVYVIIMRGMTHIGTFMFLIGVSCFFYAKILRQRGKVGDTQIAAAVSQLKKVDFELHNHDLTPSEFGGIWLGKDSSSIEENHWKSYRSSISNKKPKNKVDIFVTEVSLHTFSLLL